MFKNFNPMRSILAILLLFIPLYPKFPLIGVSGTYVSIRLDDIIVALCLIIYTIYQIKYKFPVLKDKIWLLYLAYFIAITLSFLNAVLIYQTDPFNILFLNLLRRFEYISVFFIALSALKKTSDYRFVYIFTFITSTLVAVYGFGQRYLRFPVISTMNEEFSKGQWLVMDVWTRVSSTFAGHYDLAAYLSVILVIIGSVSVLQKNILIKLLGIINWLVLFYLLTLTASRVSTFAYFGGFIITLIFIKKYLWIVPVTLLFVFSLLNSKDLNQRLLATIPALKHQFNTNKPTSIPLPTPTIAPVAPIPTSLVIAKTTPSKPIPTVFRHPSEEEYQPIDSDVGVARSGEIRFNAEWPRAITAFKKNPLLGTGLGSITLATDNDYLRALGESGFLGFITFLLIPLYFIYKTLITKKPINYVFLGCLLTTLANASLIDVFEASKTAYLFWIMMAIYYHSLTHES